MSGFIFFGILRHFTGYRVRNICQSLWSCTLKIRSLGQNGTC
jgi:hypothetical protein